MGFRDEPAPSVNTIGSKDAIATFIPVPELLMSVAPIPGLKHAEPVSSLRRNYNVATF